MRYTKGLNEQSLIADEKTRDAVERCLQRISEAAIRLGEEKCRATRSGSALARHSRNWELTCSMVMMPWTVA